MIEPQTPNMMGQMLLPNEQAQPQEIVLSREKSLEELLDWCNSFIRASAEWRLNSFENQWRKWQRAADSIYDDAIAAKKEPWQSKAFVPITASHLDNALAQLFKTEITPNPPLEFVHRTEAKQPQMPGMPPPVNQGELIRDLVLWEREKAKYPVKRNSQLQDKVIFGSGFIRTRFETRYEDREQVVPDYEQPSIFDPGSIQRAVMGQPQQIGQHTEIKPTVVYRGIRIDHLSIWDVFPDPRSLCIKGHAIGHRYNLTYGQIVDGVEQGYYIQECLLPLKDIGSEDTTTSDKMVVEADRRISSSSVKRTDYQKNLMCYEIQARLPKKWVLIDGQEIDNPDKLVPARIQFHNKAIIAVELSDTYDGEPDITKDDYIPVPGQFYGRGIPEMLKDVNLVANESINQRLDSAAIKLNPMFAIIEKCIVDPKDIERGSVAGGFIRLKSPSGTAMTNADQMLKMIEMGSIDRSAFIEPQEWERYAHERTSITATSMGTQTNADTTLGGQEIQQGVTSDKLAYIGMLSEYSFQDDFNHGVWALIYKNYNPEDYALCLGMEKAAQLEVLSPEQVALNFRLVPKGIFEMQKKGQRQAQIAALTQQFAQYPWFNTLGAAKAQISSVDQDEATFIVPEAEAMQITVKAEQMAQGMAQQMMASQLEPLGEKPGEKSDE